MVNDDMIHPQRIFHDLMLDTSLGSFGLMQQWQTNPQDSAWSMILKFLLDLSKGLQSKSCDFSTPDLQARAGLRSREDGTKGGMYHRQVWDLRWTSKSSKFLVFLPSKSIRLHGRHPGCSCSDVLAACFFAVSFENWENHHLMPCRHVLLLSSKLFSS